MNFAHTGHIGTNDVAVGCNQLSLLESQLCSKGGYVLASDSTINVLSHQRR